MLLKPFGLICCSIKPNKIKKHKKTRLDTVSKQLYTKFGYSACKIMHALHSNIQSTTKSITTSQRHDSVRSRFGAQVLVAKLGRLQRQKHHVAQKVAGRLTNSVARWRVAHVSPKRLIQLIDSTNEIETMFHHTLITWSGPIHPRLYLAWRQGNWTWKISTWYRPHLAYAHQNHHPGYLEIPGLSERSIIQYICLGEHLKHKTTTSA